MPDDDASTTPQTMSTDAQAGSVPPAPDPADEDAGSDASVSSPDAWTALAPPGKPDGEVDTRA